MSALEGLTSLLLMLAVANCRKTALVKATERAETRWEPAEERQDLQQ